MKVIVTVSRGHNARDVGGVIRLVDRTKFGTDQGQT